MLNLRIYTCAHRYIDAGTCASMEMFRIHAKIQYLWLILTGDALIGRARSICCTKFMEDYEAKSPASAPYMLFVDDDILFKPDDVRRIYRDLCDGHDLVGGAYPVKDGTELACTGYGEEQPFDGSVIPCRFLATGFMGISAKLLRRMVDELEMPLLHEKIWCRAYPFFENRGVEDKAWGNIWLSEDYDFCEKASKLGVQPMLDTGVQLSHVGQRIFRFDDVVAEHERRRNANTTEATNPSPDLQDKPTGEKGKSQDGVSTNPR